MRVLSLAAKLCLGAVLSLQIGCAPAALTVVKAAPQALPAASGIVVQEVSFGGGTLATERAFHQLFADSFKAKLGQNQAFKESGAPDALSLRVEVTEFDPGYFSQRRYQHRLDNTVAGDAHQRLVQFCEKMKTVTDRPVELYDVMSLEHNASTSKPGAARMPIAAASCIGVTSHPFDTQDLRYDNFPIAQDTFVRMTAKLVDAAGEVLEEVVLDERQIANAYRRSTVDRVKQAADAMAERLGEHFSALLARASTPRPGLSLRLSAL